MTPPANDVQAIVKRLANRDASRSEATVQADVRQLLLTAPFALEEHHIDAPLEVPIGGGRRVDVEVGLTVIEIKKDLRRAGIRDTAIEQLAGYVQTRTIDLNQRYVGMLTDGAEWIAYHLAKDSTLVEVLASSWIGQNFFPNPAPADLHLSLFSDIVV